MRRRIAFVVAVCLAGCAMTGWAVEPTGSLITSAGWVKFQIVFGRFQAIATQPRLRQEASNRDQESFIFQSHSVSAQDGVAEIDYLLESPRDYLSVKWKPNGDFRFTHERVDEEHTHITYTQPVKGPVTLAILCRGKTVSVNGADLWSLAMAHPALCDQYLAPSIRLFYPALRIDETRDRIIDELYVLATEDRPCRIQVRQLVDQLGADQFRSRRTAEDHLKALGPGVLRYLAEVKPRHLDAEQRRRVRRVRAHYRVASSDCCERVAAWLAPLPATWLTLMNDEQLSRRQLAFAALCQSCDASGFKFTPHGDMNRRQAEISKLQSQLAKN